MNRNKWLLIQLGANNKYFVAAYTNRREAQKEADRTEKFGILAAIVNLDLLFEEQSGITSIDGEGEHVETGWLNDDSDS